MRKAIQILLIISMISCAFTLIDGCVTMFSDPYENADILVLVELGMDAETAQTIMGVSSIITGALSIILAIFAYKHFMAAQCASDVKTGWKIVTLILVNLIAGILMFIIKDEHFPGYIAPQQQSVVSDDYLTQFAKLKELYDSGAISEEEYTALKNNLFDKYNLQ